MARGGARPGAGKKPWALTDERKRVVEALAMGGVDRQVIARALGIHEDTLIKHCGDILERAAPIANAKVLRTMYEMAISGRVPAASIFWCKARLGWRDQDAKVEMTGPAGGPVEVVYRWADPAKVPDDRG
jgi:DNA-binding CsgD family transcriptional regulator